VLSEPLDPGANPVAQEPPRTAHGGRSRIGKGKIKPTANFYLKDGKLYSYKVRINQTFFGSDIIYRLLSLVLTLLNSQVKSMKNEDFYVTKIP
jgi:hypothetical protein